MANTYNIWRIKLLAWTHDPLEKALILMRGPGSHEEAVEPLREILQLTEVTPEERKLVERADHWAAALDRPQHPEELGRWPDEVQFWKEPEIVHPLAGDRYRLSELWEHSRSWIELCTFHHLRDLLERASQTEETPLTDEKAFLTLWRLAPETSPKDLKLGYLWRILPADTRVPDHSIWDHLALTSALATSFALGDSPVLLHVSLGPVQSFIEEARTLSDLWAGSHLLSYLAWRAIKPIAEEFGPDVIIYPSLWQVPLVDAWLTIEKGIPANPPWWTSFSDANPLFRAALPNVFVALVPEASVEETLQKVKIGVAKARDEIIAAVVDRLLADAKEGQNQKEPLKSQLKRDLHDFPELKYAYVPFSPIVEGREGIRQEGYQRLKDLLRQLRDGSGGKAASFLQHPFWELLERDAGFSGGEKVNSDPKTGFSVRYKPNPGSLYPALRELADDFMALAKSVRDFSPQGHEGYRCDLCGEREWLRLSSQEELRYQPPGARARYETLWKKIREEPVWGRKGEHLCGRCAVKRFWPSYFAKQVAQWQVGEGHGEPKAVSRFVVSTHTMALARDLEFLLKEWDRLKKERSEELEKLKSWVANQPSVALPLKLARELGNHREKKDLELLIRGLPSLLDAVGSERTQGEGAKPPNEDDLSAVLRALIGRLPERYYALILMDGDRMGQWVSGDPEIMIPLKECWHSKLANYVAKLPPGSNSSFLDCPRPGSASHHRALSAALNAFALQVAPWVVEELFQGRLIYCGGDDLLAMVSVDDLLPCMFMLRCAFSGIFPMGDKNAVWSLYSQLKEIQDDMGAEGDVIARGYVRKKKDFVLRVMGGRAAVSMGAVVAHHMSPLSAVLRQLRAAEKAAKANGRNSFSIAILKRSGGALRYTARWGFGGTNGKAQDIAYKPETFKDDTAKERSPMSCLFELRDTLALPGVSRRAVYQAVRWLDGMPPNPLLAEMDTDQYVNMLAHSLAYQFHRHGVKAETFRQVGLVIGSNGDPAVQMARSLVNVAMRQCQPQSNNGRWQSVPDHLSKLMQVAEFLAREGRAVEPLREGGGQ